ncbi:MAG: hypothetical protein ACJ75R_03625 [Solirubrobacterales bacterium]
MSGRNGERKPPRPQIEMLTTAAGDSEAAAIVAAVEQFIADTAPAPSAGEEPSRWQRVALEEGIGARQIGGRGWGPAR